jgi:hypothetical protein
VRATAGRAFRTGLVAMTACLAQSVASAHAATVLILNGKFAAEERRLEESLRIYTRDMGIRIVIAGDTPASVENDALEALARQAQQDGADVVAWTGRRTDGTTAYYVLSVQDRDLRETDIAELGGSRAAETAALKVRTILVRQRLRPAIDAADLDGARPSLPQAPRQTSGSASANEGRPGGDTPASSPTGGSGPRASATAPAGEPLRTGTLGNGTALTAAPAEVRPRRLPRAALEADYSAVFPSDGTWSRQGLTITAEARLGGGPFHAYLDATLTGRAQRTGANFMVNLQELPFGAGVLWRWERAHLSLATGPRAALHVIEAQSSSSDGNSGSARQLSGALGAVGKIEVKWREWVRFDGGVVGEALLPARTFTVRGAPAIHTGAIQVGFLVGVGILVP